MEQSNGEEGVEALRVNPSKTKVMICGAGLNQLKRN